MALASAFATRQPSVLCAISREPRDVKGGGGDNPDGPTSSDPSTSHSVSSAVLFAFCFYLIALVLTQADHRVRVHRLGLLADRKGDARGSKKIEERWDGRDLQRGTVL